MMTDKRVKQWMLVIKTFLPKIKRPHGNLKYEGFLAYARSLPDTHKTRLRRMLTCLDMNGEMKQDYKLTRALYTKRDIMASKQRNKNRRLFIKLGLVSKNDGTHIHHIDGNVFNNARSNLAIVNGKAHKKAHAQSNVLANLACKSFLKSYRKWKKQSKQ